MNIRITALTAAPPSMFCISWTRERGMDGPHYVLCIMTCSHIRARQTSQSFVSAVSRARRRTDIPVYNSKKKKESKVGQRRPKSTPYKLPPLLIVNGIRQLGHKWELLSIMSWPVKDVLMSPWPAWLFTGCPLPICQSELASHRTARGNERHLCLQRLKREATETRHAMAHVC